MPRIFMLSAAPLFYFGPCVAQGYGAVEEAFDLIPLERHDLAQRRFEFAFGEDFERVGIQLCFRQGRIE